MVLIGGSFSYLTVSSHGSLTQILLKLHLLVLLSEELLSSVIHAGWGWNCGDRIRAMISNGSSSKIGLILLILRNLGLNFQWLVFNLTCIFVLFKNGGTYVLRISNFGVLYSINFLIGMNWSFTATTTWYQYILVILLCLLQILTAFIRRTQVFLCFIWIFCLNVLLLLFFASKHSSSCLKIWRILMQLIGHLQRSLRMLKNCRRLYLAFLVDRISSFQNYTMIVLTFALWRAQHRVITLISKFSRTFWTTFFFFGSKKTIEKIDIDCLASLRYAHFLCFGYHLRCLSHNWPICHSFVSVWLKFWKLHKRTERFTTFLNLDFTFDIFGKIRVYLLRTNTFVWSKIVRLVSPILCHLRSLLHFTSLHSKNLISIVNTLVFIRCLLGIL